MIIKHVGIYANSRREDVHRLCVRVADVLKERQVEVYTIINEEPRIGKEYAVNLETFRQKVQLLLVIGGDGTFLRGAKFVGDADIPLLGINKGHLGFLSEIEVEEFFKDIDRILSGKCTIEPRMMIEGTVTRGGKVISCGHALNELVIERQNRENTIGCEVYLGSALIDRYIGDGLIIATPTGSTGYSLSAGGPLIYPGTDCLIVTPICAHFLGTPAVIVPANQSIDVKITKCATSAYVNLDGVNAICLKRGDYVRVQRSDIETQMMHVRRHPFFEAVRNKLLNRNYRK